MFEHIRKHLPWQVREERKRKEAFIKKLQEPGHGSPKIRFKDASKIPDGSMLLVQDYRDGSMFTAIYSSCTWITYGTNGGPTTLTSVELEDMLTEKRNLASKKDKFMIRDQAELLNIDYSVQPTTAGFSKIDWHNIGNNEDE